MKKVSSFQFPVSSSRRNLKKGFTLVELIIYMALMAIFLITLTDVFVSILNVHLESTSKSSVEQDARFILARLNFDIPRASAVTSPETIGDSSNTLALTIGGTPHTFQASSGNLQLTDTSGTHNLNSSETRVTNLTFQRIGNSGGKDTIRFQFTLESKTQRPQGPEIKSFTTTVGRR